MKERYAIISTRGQILEYHKSLQKALDRMIELEAYDILDRNTNIYYSQNLRMIFNKINNEKGRKYNYGI